MNSNKFISKSKQIWVKNISDRDVSLTDLNLTIKSNKSINLLDSKRYHLTEEQINNSLKSGSLYKKSSKIKLLANPPNINKSLMQIMPKTSIPTRARSGIPIIAPNYTELEISDDAFAEELAETAEQDRQPRHSRS